MAPARPGRKYLKESDEAIGNPKTVESFAVDALSNILGVQITKDKKGFLLFTQNLPESLKTVLPALNRLKVSFYSPAPEGYIYLGRNHVFVEQLCQQLIAHAMKQSKEQGPGRSAVIRCREVAVKTTLLLFRVRNVIQEKAGKTQLVAEEMLIWGYEGSPHEKKALTHERALELMNNALPSANMTEHERGQWLTDELKDLPVLGTELDRVAMERANILIEAHERFRKVLGGTRYKVVEPVLPMDLMGVYILLPDTSR